MASIRFEGLDELVAKIATLEQLKALGKATRAAAIHIRGKIAQYPARRHGPNPNLYGGGARAAKMRRGFFAKLKAGEIDVPYRRGMSPGSQSLGKKWNIVGSNNNLTQVVGNNVSYGPLVQSDKGQTAYHAATGWKTVEQVAHEEEQTVVEFIADELQRIIGS